MDNYDTEQNNNPYIYQKSKKHKKRQIKISQNIVTDDKSKRLMCNNILKNGKCCYGNKCVFSHTLKEQRKDPIRKTVYEMISKKDVLNNNTFEIITDKNIIKTLYLFTKKCSLCEQNKCPGGYNCVTGVISQDYIICTNDLDHGFCSDNKCNKIHLSKKGYIIEKKVENVNVYDNYGITLDDSFFYKINCMKFVNDMIDDSDLESCGSYERIKEYLNDDDSGTYDESIFIFE